ncbi:MAG: sigma-70 family RNA polymerase sigma factor [bacterium]|nr:sigma-70 family RNA polymerase sigma factor [bacterium]
MELNKQNLQSSENTTAHQVVGDNSVKSVDSYLPYVLSIAKQVKKSLSASIEIDDLVSYGVTGLLEAQKRFDPTLGANFTTFSYYRIRGAIYDGLRKMGWVSRHEYQKIKFGEKATAYLETVAKRNNTQQPLKKNAQEEIADLATQVNHLVTIFVTSLDGLEDSDFEDNNAVRADVTLEKHELRSLVKKAIKQLPEDEQNLICLYYFKEKSLEEVGREIGLSKSWTSRRHAQIIDKLSLLLKNMLL